MNLPNAYGLLSQGALIAALGMALWPASRRGSRARLICLAAGAAAIFLPLGGLTAAECTRGVWGDASVVTTLLLLIFVVSPRHLPCRVHIVPALAGCLVLGAGLYGPLLAAQLPVDINLYHVGWRPVIMLAFVVPPAYLMRNRLDPRWVVIVACAVLAYAVGLMESCNLWDYLVDPGLMIGVLVLSDRSRFPLNPQSVQHSPAAP